MGIPSMGTLAEGGGEVDFQRVGATLCHTWTAIKSTTGKNRQTSTQTPVRSPGWESKRQGSFKHLCVALIGDPQA